ncbi:MAG: glycosyltransferase family 4 protein [Actinomycetota bacterium]
MTSGQLDALHQYLPSFAGRDAIGLHVLEVRRLLRSLGLASEIFSEDIHAEMRSTARSFEALTEALGVGNPGVLYHASTGSRHFDRLCSLGVPLICDYHNITQPAFFERWSPGAADNMRLAREQLAGLASSCERAIAHSHYSAAELTDLGFPEPAVVPILVDFARFDAPPDRRTAARLRREGAAPGAHWLYVGRVAPNKCHHHLIAAFAVYRSAYDPGARLSLVGGATSESYWKALEGLCRELELGAAVEFADTVSDGALLAYYRSADLFVSMSQHEGFGVPLLEAMHFGIPVLARAASAVPETVGEGGLLLDTSDPVAVAVAARRILGEEELRQALVKAGRARIEELSLHHARRLMADALAPYA